MAMSKADAIDTASRILPRYRTELERLDRIDRYHRGEHDGPYKPKSANREYDLLAKRAVTNLMPLVVNGMAQGLYIENYRRGDSIDASGAWKYWQANGFDGRQSAVHRASLLYGTSFVTVLPGKDDTGAEVPVMRGVSPRRMFAVWPEDDDDWPLYVLRVERSTLDSETQLALRLYDDTAVYYLSGDPHSNNVEYIETRTHDIGVTPVIAFRDVPDLEGRAPGEVEPLIVVQDRLNQTVFDLLVAQTFGSFKVRHVSGMAPELGPDGKPVPLPVDQKRFLFAEDPDTRWGQLDETDLGPLLASTDATIRHLAVISQTPPQDLLGNLANLSAEALAAARAGETRKRIEREHVFGEAWERTLRLAAAVAGDSTGARDLASQVTWRDVEARSLAQVADALGKIATMLGVPVEALWSRIPGVTGTDVEQWKALKAAERASDPLARVATALARQGTPAV